MRTLLAALLLLLTAATIPAQTFQNPRLIPTPNEPFLILHADLNGDGRQDILELDTPLGGPVSARTLLNAGGATFTPGPVLTLPVGVGSNACVLIDYNQDNHPDLACPVLHYPTITTTELVYLFPGRPDGSFGAPVTITLPLHPYGIVSLYNAGDLNGDGSPDLLLIDPADQDVGMPALYAGYALLSDGHGNLVPQPRHLYLEQPITFADVNGDGFADALYGGYGREPVTVALGVGDGTFHSSHIYSAVPSVNVQALGSQCAFGDLDQDGHLDAACTYIDPSTAQSYLVVQHGFPDGSFATIPSAILNLQAPNTGENHGAYADPIAVADFNGDGIPDVFGVGADDANIYFGTGAGQLAQPLHFAVSGPQTFGQSQRCMVTDIDGDGLADTLCNSLQGILLSLGRSNRTLATAQAFKTTGVIFTATVADFNGDGIPDIISAGDSFLTFAPGSGDGTFPTYSILRAGGVPWQGSGSHPAAGALLHGDFDADGSQQLVAGGYTDSSNQHTALFYLRPNGDGSFQTPIPFALDCDTFDVIAADLNRDGHDDILCGPAGSDHFTAYLSRGHGLFTPVFSPAPQEIYNGVAASESLPALADFDGDGIPDIVIGAHNNAYILHGNGDGTFSRTLTLPAPRATNPYYSGGTLQVATGDFDGDGNQDIVMVQGPWDTAELAGLFLFYGRGDGTFSAPVELYTSSFNIPYITTAGLNHDGRDEILAFLQPYQGVAFATDPLLIFYGNAARTVSQPDWIVSAPAPNVLARDAILAVDVNHDGKLDLLIPDVNVNFTSGDAVTVLLNQSTPTVTGSLRATPEPSAYAQPFTLTATLTPPDTSTLAGCVTFSLDGTTLGSAPLIANVATLPVPPSVYATLAAGTHALTATWPGNTTYPPLTFAGSHRVLGLPTTLALASSLNPASAGTPITLTSTLATSASPAPPATGTLTLADGPTILRTTPLTAATLPFADAFTTSTLTPGTHTLTASYSGDALYAAATATLTQVISAVPAALTLTAAPSPAAAGQSVTLSAQLTATACPSCAFTGSIQFTQGATLLGTAPLSSSGLATLTTSFAAAGSYTLTAAFAGDPSHSAATGSTTLLVNATITTTTLAAAPNPVFQNQPLTLTASVNSVSNVALSGTVTFTDTTTATLLGTLPLAANHATITTSTLAAGTHLLTATYSGSTAAAPSTSSPVTVQVLAADFNVTANPSTLTLATEHHTTLQFTLTSLGSFSDAVTLAHFAALPPHMTLRFTPAGPVQLTPGATVTLSAYLDTDDVLGYRSANTLPLTPLACLPGLPILALPLLALSRNRRRRLPTLLAAALISLALFAAGGCSSKYPASTPPGTYTLHLQASAESTHIVHTLDLPVTITPEP